MIRFIHIHQINLIKRPFLFHVIFIIAYFLFIQETYCQKGLQLSGNETHIRISSDPDFELDSFTLECWLMITGEGRSVRSSAFNEYSVPVITRGIEEDDTGSFINYYLGIREDDNVLMAEFESAPIEEVPGVNYYMHGYTSLNPLQWYHVAVTFDRHDLKIYLNGNLEASIEAPYIPALSAPADVGIGTVFFSNDSSTGQLIGVVDEVRIWNIARSRAQIVEYLNAEMEGIIPGLVFRLGFNEGDEDVLAYNGNQSFNVQLEGADYSWSDGAAFQAMHAPQCTAPPNLRIGMMADPQYCDCDPKRTRYYRETLWKLPEAIEAFNKEKLDFVVTLGDVIDKYPESYDSVLPFYDALTVPDFKVLGNHEFEEIPDEMKDTIINMLGMPHYYYDTVYGKYRFIFIDATEMGLYSRAVHPEISEEADSLWDEIQGEPKAKIWNSGVGRTQRSWIESRIQLAMEQGQSVILMGHHQIYPDSTIGNMWNDVQLTELFEKYPNVLAYVNGHNHWGDKGLKNGKQYFTHKGMVETETQNAYSILEIYNDRFEFKGYGAQESITFKVRKQDSLSTSFTLQGEELSYLSDSGDVVGRINSTDNYSLNYFLTGSEDGNDNRFFYLNSNVLHLKKSALPLRKASFSVAISALSCGFDTITQTLHVAFDTLALQPLKSISDTILHIESNDLSITLDKFIQDRSERGLVFQCKSENLEVVESEIHNDTLILRVKALGESRVSFTATDLYSGQWYSDTFNIIIADTANTPPVAIGFSDTAIIAISQSTWFMPWDSLFFDSDSDTIGIASESAENNLFDLSPSDSGFMVRPLSVGAFYIAFTATDWRGGMATDTLDFYINAPPELLQFIPDSDLKKGENIRYFLNDFFTDDEALNYRLDWDAKVLEVIQQDDLLALKAIAVGQSRIVVWATDEYGHTNSTDWTISVKDTSVAPGALHVITLFADDILVYPNPFISEIFIKSSVPVSGSVQLFNAHGQVLYTKDIKQEKVSVIDLSDFQSGIYLLKLTTNGRVITKALVKEK